MDVPEKILIQTPNEAFLYRKPTPVQIGDLIFLTVRYNGDCFLVGDGQEILTGEYPEAFALGAKLPDR